MKTFEVMFSDGRRKNIIIKAENRQDAIDMVKKTITRSGFFVKPIHQS